MAEKGQTQAVIDSREVLEKNFQRSLVIVDAFLNGLLDIDKRVGLEQLKTARSFISQYQRMMTAETSRGSLVWRIGLQFAEGDVSQLREVFKKTLPELHVVKKPEE